ncbi:hypothetical protein [Pelistega ratti]|uniref:hypothetical protein n=1 Tax=Pelistega ratti TaxID=2652177 RepID=UPI001357D9AD|nr:hypothetical protein [Pelistega ratti]
MKKMTIALLALLVSTQVFAISVNDAQSAISNFYTQYVFGIKDLAKNKKVGTAHFLQKLQDLYEYDCEDTCYATEALRTGAQDELEENAKSKIINITPKDNSQWYRVEYLDMGWKGITDIKVVKENDIIKIDDFKSVFDGAR